MNLLRSFFLAGALLALAGPARANMILNGSFENGPEPGERIAVASGSGAIAGWTVTGGAILYVGSFWQSAEGGRNVHLNVTTPGGIRQTFATTPGNQYQVNFQMAGYSFMDLRHMRVSAAGQSQDFSFDTGHSWPWDMFWELRTFLFTANATATTLQFTSLDPDSTGPAIDNVIVSGPEAVGVDPAGVGLALAPPSPNPTAGTVDIAFSLPAPARVRLTVSDVLGREVIVLADGVQPAGRRVMKWDGGTARGAAPAGLYFVRLTTPRTTLVRKIVRSR